MYLFKKFKNRSFEFLGGFTRTYWTFGIQVHWNSITRKDDPELSEDGFFLDFHILCFDLSFNYWRKSE